MLFRYLFAHLGPRCQTLTLSGVEKLILARSVFILAGKELMTNRCLDLTEGGLELMLQAARLYRLTTRNYTKLCMQLWKRNFYLADARTELVLTRKKSGRVSRLPVYQHYIITKE
jgi:hypothetical protein